MNPNPADTLGALLRQQRQTLSRQDVGLPETGKRRAPGLTLAEVAVLAGVRSWSKTGSHCTNTMPSNACSTPCN